MATPTTILSRREIENLIYEGKVIIIYENRVLNIGSWLPKHPGGDIVAYHMVGRDATDEINAYHSEEAKSMARKYQIGRIEKEPWSNFIPPIQGGVYRPLNQEDASEVLIGIERNTKKRQGNVITRPSSSSSSSSSSPYLSSSDAASSTSSLDELTEEEIKKTVLAPKVRKLPKSRELMEEFEKSELVRDLEIYPSLDYDTQHNITLKFRELEAQMLREGYFECNYWNYGRECVRYISLAAMSYYLLRIEWYMLSAVLLGMFWQQLTFTVHDAGHLAITHNFIVDNLIGGFIADFMGGLSVGWWKWNHNVHHIVTNDPIHDPDIQHLPFFAVSTRLFNNVFSTYYKRILQYDTFSRVLIRIQHWTYYPILCFGRFNLYRLSFEYLLLGQGPKKGIAAWIRYYELVGLLVFWYWYGYLLLYRSLPSIGCRISYILISHTVTMLVHVQITLSHFAMSTSDLGASESFAQKMLRTTMDVDCPPWLDFLHGGLQFQAVHHLFPRMPRHNFRAAQKPVIKFCNSIGVKYCIYGFTDGNKEVISRLAEIAKQASIFADCSKTMVRESH
ncbi:fatty acid desaturase-domain-containing protein [Dipodascopsis uninucleata]